MGEFQIKTIIIEIMLKIRYGRHIGHHYHRDVIDVKDIPDQRIKKRIIMLEHKF